MTPEDWAKISNIYHIAAELDAGPRQEYLDDVCKNDPTLRIEIETLLSADDKAGNFIAEPIVGPVSYPLTDHEPHPPNGRLGHYIIERRIGSGGMGDVFLAHDTKLERKVAIKKLPSDTSDDPTYRKRFRIEALAAANINHPNAAVIYSIEDFEDQPFLTMEFVDGETLDRKIPAQGLPLDQFVDWFSQIADALYFAHSKGVVHRDVKPGNIMIVDDRVPKILDFGLAQFERRAASETDSDIHITKPGQVIGTPAYMSPEQAEGKKTDHRTDIFSLGIVMYEALTGKRPFQGDSHAEIVSNLLKTSPESVRLSRPDIPDDIETIVNKCLEKEPRDRFESMSEVKDAISALRAGSRSGRSFESFQRKLFKESQTPSVAWLPFAALLVFVAAIGAWYLFANDGSSTKFGEIAFRKLSQSNNVVFAHVTSDGRSLVYNTIEDNEMRAMYIRRIDDRNSLLLVPPQTVQYWGGLTTDDDGNQVYYITADRVARHGTLFRVSSLGGQPRKLAEMVNDLGSLSPDGSRLLYVRYAEEVQLISGNAVDGSDERIIQRGGPNVIYRDPQYSLDGRSIFTIRFDVIDGSEFWSVVQIPETGGDEKVIVPMQIPRISELVVLRSGEGILMNATDPVSNLPQIYHLEPETGVQTRLTNDLNSYFGISSDETGTKIVSAQRFDERSVWIADTADWSKMKRISPEPNAYLHAEFTPSGEIVFDAMDNNRPHIYKMDADGRNVQQLTPNGSSDQHPKVTPDGRFIFFTSDRSGEQKVWRMKTDGAEPVLFTPGDGSASAPGISPDGRFVYFFQVKNNERMLAYASVDGDEISRAPFQPEQYWGISPDGKLALATYFNSQESRSRVKMIDLSTLSEVAELPISPLHILQFTADGKKVIYREREAGQNPNATVWQMDLADRKPIQLFDVSPESIVSLNYSTDRQRAVLVRGKLITDAVLITRKITE